MNQENNNQEKQDKEPNNEKDNGDFLPVVDDDDDLDDEVRSCLLGVPGFKSNPNSSSSPDSCSFYSSCTMDDRSQDNIEDDMNQDNIENNSFFSDGNKADTDNTSYCSIETLQGEHDPADSHNTTEEGPDLPEDHHPTPATNPPNLPYTRPSYLAGPKLSESTGSNSSIGSEADTSITGQVNQTLSRILSYVGRGDGTARDTTASIVGYEQVNKEKDTFTIYKVKVSSSSSLPLTWFIHRRYSDFYKLRKTLLKENQQFVAKISFPPKRWVGSNLEPSFLGRRLAGLQVFLASLLDIPGIKSHTVVESFLCLDKPPLDAVNDLESNRAICDTLEETVKELREQLRRREVLEFEVEHLKNMNGEKDKQIESLHKENVLLRQQKESLMNVLSSGRRSGSARSLADPTLSPEHSRIETLEDFTAKFNLKIGEGPNAVSTPNKLGARRRMYSHGEKSTLGR